MNYLGKIKHLKEAENKIDELERTLACKLDNFLDNKDFELSEMCDDLCLTKLFGQVLEKNKVSYDLIYSYNFMLLECNKK